MMRWRHRRADRRARKQHCERDTEVADVDGLSVWPNSPKEER